MDERLRKALEFSNYMVTFENQKNLSYEKFLENSVYYFNGSKFSVTQELMAFVQSLLANNQTFTILIDDNNIPVEIKNLENFSTQIYKVYIEAAKIFLSEYDTIKKNRSVSGLIDL